MRSPQTEADVEQRARQARIEQDIRALFARYRTVRSHEDAPRQKLARPARRFVRDAERTAQHGEDRHWPAP